jgi:nitroimidazol reductase NimA-like FMN-containing flavoprotein (pyridoxamine 5'-phosphate oxidase superfamily)
MSQGLLRRKDKQMELAEVEQLLEKATVAHFGTVSEDGFPYVVPNLFVYADGKIYTHNSSATGHFRRNITHSANLCFEVAEMGQVFPYGEFECDTSTSYASAIGFGTIRVETDPAAKARFFDLFLAKYADPAWDRPKSFYPRLEQVTVYCIEIREITGKKGPLLPVSEQWPAKNKTLSPNAVPPGRNGSNSGK